MSTGKVTVRPESTDEECSRLMRLKAGVSVEIIRMNQTKALLIGVQFAAEHDSEFVISDALAAILSRLDVHLANLDRQVTEAAA